MPRRRAYHRGSWKGVTQQRRGRLREVRQCRCHGCCKSDSAVLASHLRSHILSLYERYTANASYWQLNQNQFDALVSFAFNLGCGNLRNIADDLNKNDFSGATANMKKYVNAGGNVLPGLVRRRNAEVELFNS